MTYSLCRVSRRPDYPEPWLIRLADVEDDTLKVFQQDREQPKLFDNRDRLFWRNGPDNNGAFGIWEWSAVPNLDVSSRQKDHIKTKYVKDMQAVEVIEILSAPTIGSLLDTIVNEGLIIVPVSNSMLLCPRANSNKYEGVLCTRREFSLEDGHFRLEDSVFSLPLYSFTSEDTISLDGKVFYKKLDCGEPVRKILVKEPLEIVRNIILRRTSWSAVKTQGITKSTWRIICGLIAGLPADSVYEEVASVCQCSEERAKIYIDRFLSQAEKYIGHEDYDSSVMAAVIENNSGLRAKIEGIVSERWHEEHKEAIIKAEKEIEALTSEIKTKTDELNARKSELSSAEAMLEDIKERIQAQEQLAEDISVKVKSRISEARKDAADFIAEMAFTAQPTPQTPAFYSAGRDYVSDDADCNDSWKGAVETLSLELREAGVAEQYTLGFSAFLYSAYINHFPTLLAGPNGESISDAFSVSLFGKTAGVADCSVPYSPGVEIGTDDVFMVKHVFRNEWIAHIAELQKFKGYHFIIHPFTEDLFIEPKSLFSYALPVFTELIVDSLPAGNYIGAKRSQNYEEYKPQKPEAKYDKLLKSLGFTSYARNRLQAVITDFHALMASVNAPENTDFDCLFAVFPYALITCRDKSALPGKISGSMRITSGLNRELSAFMGIDDEEI